MAKKGATITIDQAAAEKIDQTIDNLKRTSVSARWERVQEAGRQLELAYRNQADVQSELKSAKARVDQMLARLIAASSPGPDDDMPLFAPPVEDGTTATITVATPQGDER